MPTSFDKMAAKGNAFINEMGRTLGWVDDPAKTLRVLKAVLHALREQLTWEESLQMMAQLPMFMKALYVEGWSPKAPYKVKDVDAFYDLMRTYNVVDEHDLPNREHAEVATQTVFVLLRQYVSAGEMEDIVSQMPKELKPLLAGSIPLM